MNKLDNTKLISLVTYKLKDTLFDLMYDIVENPVNEIANPPDKIKNFENKIRELYSQLADNFDKDISERNDFTNKLTELENEIISAAVDINKYTCANNQLGEYILREMKLIKISDFDERIPLNNSAVANNVEHYLSHLKNDMEGAFLKGELMAQLPLRMTKAKYRDYIKKGFYMMSQELSDGFVQSITERLKDMCYVDCIDKMNEDFPLMAQTIEEIYKLPVSEFNNENIEEYFNMIDDNVDLLQDIYICLGVLFNDITYMNILSDFVIDSDFMFEEDFVLKDLYYSICDCIRDNDDLLFETITDNLSTEIENRFEKFKGLEAEISKAVNEISDINELDSSTKLSIDVNNAISNSYMKDIDKVIMSGTGNNDKSADELADELCDYIESAVSDLPLPRQKYIKQNFLQHIPCTMSNAEITDYTNYSLNGINDRTVNIMAYGDIFNVTEQIEDEDEHNHHHKHKHHHGDHCSCGEHHP